MKYFILFFIFFVQLSFAQVPTKCFEVESILVDACGGSVEGQNEMVRFTVGPMPIDVQDLDVTGGSNTYQSGKWPTGNLFLGIASPPANQAKVDSINATITSCGRLIEPANGILLPGMKVLLITSTAFNINAQSFSSLGDTLYVIFHNSLNTGGNFSNYTGSPPTNNRNFVLVNTATGCADTVKYKPSLLTTQTGSGDGDAVNYAWDGTATYYNNGCQAPFVPVNPSWNPPPTMCADAAVINLNTLITGDSGGVWSGTGVIGNSFNPANAIGTDTITYTLNSLSCPSFETHNITVLALSSASWALPDSICASEPAIDLYTLVTGTTGGTWTGSGVIDSSFNPGGLSGNINITYTAGMPPCTISELHTIYVIAAPTAVWNSPDTVCKNTIPINLNTLLTTGTHGGVWTINGVSDSIFDPASLSGVVSINYTIGTIPCQASETNTIVVLPLLDAAWIAPDTMCALDAAFDLNNTITGVFGGSFSGNGVAANIFSPAGLSGNYIITYTVGPALCQSSQKDTITVTPPPDASWTTPVSICELAVAINLDSLVTGAIGGVWSGNGMNGSLFNPSGLSGNIDITYTVGMAPCSTSVTHSITVNAAPSAGWTAPDTMCILDAPISLNDYITGVFGGVWSGGGVTGSSFSPTGLSGYVSIIYTVGIAPCQSSQTDSIYVDSAPDAAWNSPNAICQSGSNINLSIYIAGDIGGSWSGTGVSGNIFNPSGLSGNVQITYSVGTAPCISTQTHTINVIAPPNASWTPPVSICVLAPSINLNPLVTGVTGGTWTGTGVTGNMFNPAGLSGNISVTYTVSVNGCAASSIQAIPVVATPNASWIPQDRICESANSLNLDSLVVGIAGGSWSGIGVTGNHFSPSGLNGAINITYTVGAAPCSTSSIHAITVMPSPSSTWISPDTLCQADSPIILDSLITGDLGGVWTGTGVTGSVFSPTGLNGNYLITYTIGASPCISTTVHSIRVMPLPNPSWTPLNPICQSSPPVSLNTYITGTTGGTWTGSGVIGNTFNPSGLSGVITIVYTLGATPCQSSESHTVIVSAAPSAAWSAPISICQNGGQIILNSLISGTSGGTWSGSGVFGNFFSPIGLSGNQVITYTVSSGTCTSAKKDTIMVIVSPVVSIMNPDVLCNRTGFYNLNQLLIGLPNGTWSGIGVHGNFLAMDSLNGNTAVTYTAINAGCSTKVTKTIIKDTLNASFIPSIYSGDSPLEVSFNNTSVGAHSYEWNLGNNSLTEETNPVKTYELEGTYTVVLTAHSINGCIDTANAIIEVIPADVFIPNSFSPNNDGVNDLFAPVISGHVEDYSFFVYNRWGDKIYESSEQNVGWDGKAKGKVVQQGVYSYIVIYTIPGKTKRKVGVIYIMR